MRSSLLIFALLAMACTPFTGAAVDCSIYRANTAEIQTVAPTPEPNPAVIIASIDAVLRPQADIASIDSAENFINEAAVEGVASIFSSASSNTLPVFAHLNAIVVKEGCTESVKALLKDALDDVSPTIIPLALKSIDTAPVGQLAACIQEAGL